MCVPVITHIYPVRWILTAEMQCCGMWNSASCRRCTHGRNRVWFVPIRMAYAFNHLHHIYIMIVSQKMICGVTFMVTTGVEYLQCD